MIQRRSHNNRAKKLRKKFKTFRRNLHEWRFKRQHKDFEKEELTGAERERNRWRENMALASYLINKTLHFIQVNSRFYKEYNFNTVLENQKNFNNLVI